MTSWQTRTYQRLRDHGWYQVGALFEAIETEIPLHLAMRTAMQSAHGRTELPTATVARWRKFLDCLSAIGVETNGKTRNCFKWGDEVRLRYVEGRVCGDCGGPVIKASWASGRYKNLEIACLACEAARAAPPKAEEPFIQEVVLSPPPPTDRIGEAVAYAVLHRLIAQWGPPMSHRAAAPWRQGNQPGEPRAPPPMIHFWPVREPIRSKPQTLPTGRLPNLHEVTSPRKPTVRSTPEPATRRGQ